MELAPRLGAIWAEGCVWRQQNDSWSSGQSAGFQSGFVSNEEGAATLGPVSQGMLLGLLLLLARRLRASGLR